MEVVIVLLLAGAILLLLETVLPGLVAGTLGFCCLVAGVVLAYVRGGPNVGTVVLIVTLLGLIIGTAAWIKYFPESRIGQLFISKGVVGELRAEKPELLGQTGTAYTHLRPSGMAMIGGRRVDVVTEGSMIERGTPIKVVAVEGMRVVVRPLTDEELAAERQKQKTGEG